MRRRDFIRIVAGSAAFPLAANAQPSNKPVIGFLSARSAKESAHLVDAFRKGLAEHGIVEGQNVIIEFSCADSNYERLPAHHAAMVHWAMIIIMGRRLARYQTTGRAVPQPFRAPRTGY